MKYYHHGDVLLTLVDAVEGEKVEPDRTHNVLALGEVTGHAHVLEKEKTTLYKNKSGILFVSVEQPVFLRHLNIKTFKELPESEHPHDDIPIPVGNYRMGIVQQYDPFKKELENVMD